MTKRHYIPALRGRMGDWAYYSTLMKLREVARRVEYAEELHQSHSLSDMIQRELKSGRGKEIANYLKNHDDRFFNSLVVAIYGGSPGWHELSISANRDDIAEDDLDDTALYSIGYLSLTENEKIFALDGQHRLAGIRRALKEEKALGDEELSVIFVAHHNDEPGLRRTRKLFTTLNKQARPVKKSEIIALDESDMMAIATRHLVENHEYFNCGQIDVMRTSPNLAANNFSHLTTIINLYDVLCIAIPHIKESMAPKEAAAFKMNRPCEEAVEDFNSFAEQYFTDLANAFKEFKNYFSSKSKESYLKKMRTEDGGHILFRPVGLRIFTEVLRELRKTLSYEEAKDLLGLLPVQMAEAPYADTIWNTHNRTMDVAKRPVCRDLLVYMLGHGKNLQDLKKRYAKALEIDVNDFEMPEKLVDT